MHLMGTRERPATRAKRAAGAATGRVVADIRLARRNAGLSLEEVGRRCELSRSQASRIERGLVRRIDPADLFCMAEAVGLAISVRTYPLGDPIRDAAHLRLLERFRARIASSLRWATEVPLPIPGDRRSWDAVVSAVDWFVPAEAETVVDDAQATKRKFMLKARDGRADVAVLLIAATARNRRALAVAASEFSDLPLRTREILDALGSGKRPTASGIVVL